MKQIVLSSEELLYLASKCNKKRLYGIPDWLSSLPQDLRANAIQTVVSSLLESGHLTMDLDGNVSVCEDTRRLIDMCSSCDRMLSINEQSQSGEIVQMVIWIKANNYLQAMVYQNNYQFSYLTSRDFEGIRMQYTELDCLSPDEQTAIVPYSVLRKAKRFQKLNDVDSASALLIEIGIPSELAEDIALGLFEKTDFCSLTLLSPGAHDCKTEALSYIKGNNKYISLSQKVIDYKTNIVFSVTSPAHLQERLSCLFHEFSVQPEV